MSLKLRIFRSLTRWFIILVNLTRSLFSEKMLISNRCISGLMSSLIKKSWTVSTPESLSKDGLGTPFSKSGLSYVRQWVYYLFVKQVQGKLKSNCFHVGFLQSGGNVHVHVQESLHGTPLFGLFNLQLRQKIDKPLKRSLITIDPEKVDLN